MRLFTYLLIFIAIIIGVSFACLNAEVVKVNLYISSFTSPLSLLLVSAFGLGLFCGLISVLLTHLKFKRQIFHLNQRIKLTEKELQNLRSMPLRNTH